MGETSTAKLREALGLMSEARKLLFEQLHTPGGLSQEVVEGLDRLASAFEFAENPDREIILCPACECLYWERTGSRLRCLSCDHEWNQEVPE